MVIPSISVDQAGQLGVFGEAAPDRTYDQGVTNPTPAPVTPAAPSAAVSPASAPGPSSATSSGLEPPARYLALGTVMMGVALSVMDGTAMAFVLPAITREFQVSASSAVWVVNGFQLAALVALLPLANAGDRISFRRVHLTGAALLGLASLVALFADSLPVLIAARVVQGLGAAGMMAINSALLRLIWPTSLLGRGIAINSILVGAASVGGPLLAAALLSLGSWRWLLALNVPICLLIVLVGRRTLPVNPPAHSGPLPSALDIALNAAFFILLFLGAGHFGASVKAAADRGAELVTGLALMTACLAVGAVHVRRQLRETRPLLPVDLLRIPIFRLSIMTSVCGFGAQTLAQVALPFLLIDAWHTSAGEAGRLMAFMPATTIVGAYLAGRLIGRFHNGWLGAVGLATFAAGLGSLAVAAFTPGSALALPLALCGLGFGLFQSPNNHTIVMSSPSARAGAASGMMGTARLTGQTLGATLAAVAFALHPAGDVSGPATALAVASVLALLAALVSALRTRFQPGQGR